jgi:predicted nucleic acid-binding protein
VRLAADANVLLSAVLDGQAKRVLDHKYVDEVLTTQAALDEVQEYASQLATKKRLPVDVVLLAVASLPVTIVEQAVYKARIPEAKRRIGRRDPDDVEMVALALHHGIPVWSSDNDFAGAGLEWYTTAELLAKLGR